MWGRILYRMWLCYLAGSKLLQSFNSTDRRDSFSGEMSGEKIESIRPIITIELRIILGSP
jgi:hypothetical protein